MIREIVAALLCVTVVLGIGGALTRIGPWYAALRKPSWQPPDYLFGPAWTLIGALTGWGAVLAWRGAPDGEHTTVIVLFAINAVLNVAWSALFFTLRRPDWALAEVVALWLSIVALVAAFAGTVPAAAWLLAPYLAWVSFAACLNLAVVRLNAPFGGFRPAPR